LPKPSRGSIYSAFGEDGWEEKEKEFDEVDVTPPPSPGLDGLDEEGEDEVEDKGDTEGDLHVDALKAQKHT
jgi:hypothetical protein